MSFAPRSNDEEVNGKLIGLFQLQNGTTAFIEVSRTSKDIEILSLLDPTDTTWWSNAAGALNRDDGIYYVSTCVSQCVIGPYPAQARLYSFDIKTNKMISNNTYQGKQFYALGYDHILKLLFGLKRTNEGQGITSELFMINPKSLKIMSRLGSLPENWDASDTGATYDENKHIFHVRLSNDKWNYVLWFMGIYTTNGTIAYPTAKHNAIQLPILFTLFYDSVKDRLISIGEARDNNPYGYAFLLVEVNVTKDGLFTTPLGEVYNPNYFHYYPEGNFMSSLSREYYCFFYARPIALRSCLCDKEY